MKASTRTASKIIQQLNFMRSRSLGRNAVILAVIAMFGLAGVYYTFAGHAAPPSVWKRSASFETDLNTGTDGWNLPPLSQVDGFQITRTNEVGGANGSYAAKIVSNGGNSGCSCPRMKFYDGVNYGAGSEIWMRGSYYLTDPSVMKWSRLMNMSSYLENANDHYLGLTIEGETGQMKVVGRLYQSDTGKKVIFQPRPIPAKKWFTVVLHFKLSPTNGQALNEMYIDGQLVDSNTNGNMHNSQSYNVYQGGVPYFLQGLYTTVYFDNPGLTDGPGSTTPPPPPPPSPSDTTAPSAPANLRSTAATTSSISLAWNASTDNVGVTKYEIWRTDDPTMNTGWTLAGSVSGGTLGYVDSPLSSGTTYHYGIRAYDAAGNKSASSNIISVTASGGTISDTTPPAVSLTAPANGSSASIGSTVTVSAKASDNVGVSKVEFYNGTTRLTTDTASPYSYAWNTAGQSAGTKTLTAKAYDAAGNVTTSSAVSLNLAAVATGNGDANKDGRVNAMDLSILISKDGQNYPAADFDGNGTVGAGDLSILLGKWTW